MPLAFYTWIPHGLKALFRNSILYSLAEWLHHRSFILNLGNSLGFKSSKQISLRLRNLHSLLDPFNSHVVFDIGANVGDMAATYVHAGCRVVAVEPDPSNLRVLYNRFRFIPAI